MTKKAAIVVRGFGGPEVLEAVEVDVAAPGPGQVAIAVEAASVTFVETQMRSGRPPRPEMLPRLPWIPGNGVGGTVIEVGDRVDEGLLGARVVSTTGGAGGYAARTVVDAAEPIRVPEGLALDVATALLADGRTARRLAAGAAIQEGERVLVEAAAGGVGSFLVQLARGAGGNVVATAGSGRKLEVARDLGAAEVVDYSAADWHAAVAPVDVVFDGVGSEVGGAAFGLLRPGGRYLPFGAAGGAFAPIDRDVAAERGVKIVASPPPTPAENRRLVEGALAAARTGSLRPVVGRRLPLAQAAEAHRAIEARETIGKTLLVP